MAEGLVARRESRTECGQRDQLSETFADWIAVQVTAEALAVVEAAAAMVVPCR